MNEEAGHIVLHVKHVEHDMDDDMSKRMMTDTTNEETGREGTELTESKREDAYGEQTDGVIETEHPDEELLAQCTRSDDEAGSIVEKVRDDEEADETAAAKETEERSKGRRGNPKTHRGEKKHTQRRETALERNEQMHKTCIRDN